LFDNGEKATGIVNIYCIVLLIPHYRVPLYLYSQEIFESVPVHQDRMEPSKQVEQVTTAILERLDAINDLKERLRHEFVPATVCSYLRQCHKETNVSSANIDVFISFSFNYYRNFDDVAKII